MQNLSYIKCTPIESDWNRINMSINFNRLRDLDRQIHISGYNEESSMINDFFLQDAQGTYYEDLNYFNGTASAYWTDLIDLTNDETNDTYFSNLSSSNTGQNQELRIEETGYINELGFSCSGAYKDFLFLGLSINLLDIDFSQHKSYTEYNFDEINDLQSFTYNTDLQVNGDGTNFKIGAIIKPTPSVRIGWAYHSKNYLSLYETYTSDMSANFTNFTNIDYFDYNLDGQRDIDEEFYDIQTPIKTISSLAVIFAKKGLISFDYETIDYGTARFEPNAYYSFASDNLDISTFYAKTNNIRIGLEWKLNKTTLRSGYAVYGSPFENEINDASREYMSAGLGFQNEQYFIDIAMIQSIEEEDYILYNNEFATLYNNGTTIMISCNYKF